MGSRDDRLVMPAVKEFPKTEKRQKGNALDALKFSCCGQDGVKKLLVWRHPKGLLLPCGFPMQDIRQGSNVMVPRNAWNWGLLLTTT